MNEQLSQEPSVAWRLWVRLALGIMIVACLLVVSHGDRFRSAWLWRLVGDKVPHAVAYAVLAAMFLLLGVRELVGIGLLIAVATLDELTQPWFGRSCSLGDWLTDLAGILTVCVSYALLRRALQRKPAPPEMRADPQGQEVEP